MQDCCGPVLCRHQQLCCARSAATHLLTVWAPMTPSRHRPHSSQQPGPCAEGVPLSGGSLVSESLLEQMSAVLRALQPSLLCSCSGRICRIWCCCSTWGRAGWEILTKAAGAAQGDIGQPAWEDIVTPALTPWLFPGSWRCC